MATNELPEYADRVLEAVERIPPGRVMTYGDLAAWLREEAADRAADAARSAHGPRSGAGGVPPEAERPAVGPTRRGPGPRQVGRVMALYGGAVPWWRVVRADGVLLPGHERRALERYRAEGTPLREPAAGRTGRTPPRIDLRRARWPGSAPGGEPGSEPWSESGGAPAGEPPVAGLVAVRVCGPTEDGG